MGETAVSSICCPARQLVTRISQECLLPSGACHVQLDFGMEKSPWKTSLPLVFLKCAMRCVTEGEGSSRDFTENFSLFPALDVGFFCCFSVCLCSFEPVIGHACCNPPREINPSRKGHIQPQWPWVCFPKQEPQLNEVPRESISYGSILQIQPEQSCQWYHRII